MAYFSPGKRDGTAEWGGGAEKNRVVKDFEGQQKEGFYMGTGLLRTELKVGERRRKKEVKCRKPDKEEEEEEEEEGAE